MKKIMAIVCAVIMMVCNVIATGVQAMEFTAERDFAKIRDMSTVMLEDIAKGHETNIQIDRYDYDGYWVEAYNVEYYEPRCDRWYVYTIAYTKSKRNFTTFDVDSTLAIYKF